MVALVGVAQPPPGLDDGGARGHELLAHLDRLVEEATAVVAQVENELAHPLAAQPIERLGHLAAGAARELRELEVAHLGGAPSSAGSRRG